jgi:hypothetical protein
MKMLLRACPDQTARAVGRTTVMSSFEEDHRAWFDSLRYIPPKRGSRGSHVRRTADAIVQAGALMKLPAESQQRS